MTSSVQAFIWSVGDIQDGRFWTFTVPNRQPAKVTANMWRVTAIYLKRKLGFCGIRVFEIHPGGHGLHVHVVTNKFFDVRKVRAITTKLGWGRLHVCRIRKGVADGFRVNRVGEYLAKYLLKGRKMRAAHGLKGFRLWGAFGGMKDYIRTAQVQFETPIKTIISLLTGQQVIDFWGRPKCSSMRKFVYWRMRLATAIYNNRLGRDWEWLLDMALDPVPL